MSILFLTPVEWVSHRAAIWLALFSFRLTLNGLETKISRTFLDFLHLGHEFFVISGHGT